MALIAISLQTIALALIVLFVVKMLFLIFKPEGWVKVVEFVYQKSVITILVFLALGYIVFENLIASGITYVQIMAIALFIGLLIGLSFAVYSNEAVALGKKMLRTKNFWRKAWLPVLIWTILSVLALNEIYSLW